jgi:hypothetical protein
MNAQVGSPVGRCARCMSIQTPPTQTPSTTVSDGEFDTPTPPAKAWSPIPVTIDHPTGSADRVFVPLGAPVAAAAPQPGDIADVGAVPARRTVSDASVVTPRDPASEPISEKKAESALPQRVRRLGPIDADSIQPSGPVPRTGEALAAAVRFFPDSPATQQAESQQSAQLPPPSTAKPLPTRGHLEQPTPNSSGMLSGTLQSPPTVTPTPAVGAVAGPAVSPTNPAATGAAPTVTAPAAVVQPAVVHRAGVSDDGVSNDSPTGLIAGVSNTPPPESRHTAAATRPLTGLAPVGHSIPQEVFPNAPKLVAQVSTQGAYDFANPQQYSERSTDPLVTVLPHSASHVDTTSGVGTTASPFQVDAGTVGVIDWRLFAMAALMLAYVPLMLRSLLGATVSNPLGLTALAFIMWPMSFVVVAARRPRRPTREHRPTDLVVGSLLGIASLACSQILPGKLGGVASLWRPDWLALPLTLASAYVLLWGVGFARELRNTLIIATLSGPLLFTPLLGHTWSPLSGKINPFAEKLANLVTPLTPTGYAQYSINSGQIAIDARGLIIGRALVAVLIILVVSLVLSSRVDQRVLEAGGRRSIIAQRAKKIAVVMASFASYWIAELFVTTLALILASVIPESYRSYVTSPVVGAIPILITAYAFLIWVGRFGLFLPGTLGVLTAGTRLPGHGPRGRVDHGVTAAVVGIVTAVGLLTGLRSPAPAALPVTTEVAVLVQTPIAGVSTVNLTQLDGMRAYFGANSQWNRTSMQGATTSGLEQVYLDQIDAPLDALTTFDPSTIYGLGSFVPTASRKLDLAGGQQGIQETFYDEATRSVWTVASVVVKDPTGSHRLVISGTAAGDQVVAPAPALAALSQVLVTTPRSSGVGGQTEWKDEKALATSNALATLFTSYLNGLLEASATGGLPGEKLALTDATDPFVSDVVTDELVATEPPTSQVATDSFVQ